MERPVAYQSSAPTQVHPDSVESPARVTARSWKDYVSITKVGITVANLWTAFAGLWLASHGRPDPYTMAVVLVGTAMVVGGAAALNNWIDRDIDQLMPRTSARPLASGRIPAVHGLMVGLGLSTTGLGILAVGTNVLAAMTAFIGLFTYVVIYTLWLKRTTTLNTVIGGIAGSIPPLIGWAAVDGSLGPAAWILFLTLFFWQPPHFLALAIRRVQDYRAAGIPMLPVVQGFEATKRQTLLYTSAMFPTSVLLYGTGVVGTVYLVTAAVAGIVYLVLCLWGFRTRDVMKWANVMFRYSLIYLMAVCTAIVVAVQ
ncbi:MAG: protoheme IX farnesyltransferase [Alicyclobacillaceae bacterium]|nr:protoheme IX farnesyltransferase [Alicyclobacillaceae bacterium]